ncbi:hypothetical protein [Actinospongicola halichondriae]|uniref:hypothetical protein n=1 Tax=Actinospongicola halichondriae TaxID=3236844 RepID=UPI003D4786F1
MRRVAAAGAAIAVAGTGVFAALAARDADAVALPAPSGDGPASSYRVVYEVVGDGATTTEERVVSRPFDSDITVRDADGAVTSERASRAGLLATRSSGGDWVLIDVPFSPATGDTRLDRFGATVATDRGSDEVGGRPCAVTRAAFAGEAVVAVERCTDDAGVVLREVWLDADESVLQTMTAVELTLGVDVGPEPEGTRLTATGGNGAVHAVEADEPIPFARAFTLDPGDGWDFVGRYLVVPPTLDATARDLGSSADTALVSDVWRRGPDLLVLDQGATKDGPTPFGAMTEIDTFDLVDIGEATIGVDDRLAAVNVPLADGGFLRLSATLDPTELRTLAQTISPNGGER